MEREACVCDHGFERSDLCAEIIIIIIKIYIQYIICTSTSFLLCCVSFFKPLSKLIKLFTFPTSTTCLHPACLFYPSQLLR